LKSAVTDAVLIRTQEINAEYTQRLADLKIEQDKNQTILDNKIKDTLKEKQNALQTSTNKYNDLLKWVQSQPFRTNGSTSEGNLIRDTSNPEGTRGVSFNGLLQQDAINLVEYAQRTEELKVYLNSCYRQYDDVKSTVDAFVLKHNKQVTVEPSEKP
jgi:predicted P-loop ATPase